jgi:hypothetical protein
VQVDAAVGEVLSEGRGKGEKREKKREIIEKNEVVSTASALAAKGQRD